MKEIGYASFEDNRQLTRLESSLLQIDPKEILVAKKGAKSVNEALKNLLKRVRVPQDHINLEILGQGNNSNIEYIFRDKLAFKTVSESYTNVLKCMTGIINYLRILDSEDSVDSYCLNQYDDSKFVSISVDTKLGIGIFSKHNQYYGKQKPQPEKISALDRDYFETRKFEQIHHTVKEEDVSLFDVLNHTTTKSGTRLLYDWVQTPLKDLRLIKERQNMVLYFYENSGDLVDIVETLKHVPDLARTALRIQKSTAANILKNAHEAKCAIESLPRIIKNLKTLIGDENEMKNDDETNERSSRNHSDCIKTSFHSPLEQLSKELENFVNMINMSIDAEYFKEVHEFRISSEICEALSEDAGKIANLITKSRKWFRKQPFSELNGIDIMFDKNQVTVRATKRARTIHGAKLSQKNSGMNEVESKNSEHRFSSDYLDEMTRKYKELQSCYEESQKDQLEEIRRLAIDYRVVFLKCQI